MPPMKTDGDWLTNGVGELYIGMADGGYVPFCGFPVFEEGYTMTNEAAKQFKLKPPDTDMTFTCTANIKFTRGLLKLLYTGRRLRQEIRKKEKERRRRLKEGHND